MNQENRAEQQGLPSAKNHHSMKPSFYILIWITFSNLEDLPLRDCNQQFENIFYILN